MNLASSLYFLGVGAIAASLPTLRDRLQLSRAKHRSLAGHSRVAKRVASQLPFYAYDETRFFQADGAPKIVAAQRRAAFTQLAATFRMRFARSRALTAAAQPALSDLQFTSAYRVPFQFRQQVGNSLGFGSFVQAANGVTLNDIDGNTLYDLTGSYGVNLFGIDFYKYCIAEGSRRVAELGPVLGYFHPIVESNAQALRRISGQDEVSFHMSGTEAVMQAVRLARYHTRKTHLVRFCGAYHGWWEDVQPGIGNPVPPRHTYTLQDLNERSLKVLRNRRDIACVLVNPLQALHPNQNAPSDSGLVDSQRHANFQRQRYTVWLNELRKICDERGIVLIFDEVFMGFRLGQGGAQEYFGVRADLVIYGKTLGGGLPVGVLCGKHALMRRFRDDRPADICFARGTFNSHPYVMGSMQVFLEQLGKPEIAKLYEGLDEIWDARAAALNERLRGAGLPVQVANFSSIWTVYYTQPSRYNWMLQYYLRIHGLALSWIGTGRLIFSLNYTEEDFRQVATRFVAAATQMHLDGWWWGDDRLTNQSIRRQVLGELFLRRIRFIK